MKIIENQNFPCERDLYAADHVYLKNCTFDGVEDGESALKEATNVKLENCFMNLRYPLWHDNSVELVNVTMTDKCRAALWYTEHLTVRKSDLLGIKALRECYHIEISDTKIVGQFSSEFGLLGSVLPPLAVILLFFGFAYLASGKIKRANLVKLMNENQN